MVAVRRLLLGREQELAELYLAGASTEELAAKFETSRPTIRRALHAAGVELRNTGRPRKLTPDEEREVVSLYRSGLSARQIAQHLGVSAETVGRAVRRAGAIRSHVLEGREDEIVAAYEHGDSMASLAQEHGVTQATIRLLLHRLGVTIRPAHRPRSKLLSEP